MNTRAFAIRIVLALAALTLWQTVCSAALTWATQKIELTAKPGDKEAVGVFRFSNSGPTTVTIVYIQPGCGCTTAQLEKRVYAPGEAGEIKAVFTIGDRVGEQEKTIFISTDDSPDKTVPLVLKVTIPELLTYSPRLLMWNVGEKLDEKATAISANTRVLITAIEIIAPVSSEVKSRFEPVNAGASYQLFVRPISTAAVMNTPITGQATFADGTIQPFKIYLLVR